MYHLLYIDRINTYEKKLGMTKGIDLHENWEFEVRHQQHHTRLDRPIHDQITIQKQRRAARKGIGFSRDMNDS